LRLTNQGALVDQLLRWARDAGGAGQSNGHESANGGQIIDELLDVEVVEAVDGDEPRERNVGRPANSCGWRRRPNGC